MSTDAFLPAVEGHETAPVPAAPVAPVMDLSSAVAVDSDEQPPIRPRGPRRTPRASAPAARREDLYAQLTREEGNPQFFKITEFLGKAWPFDAPLATCALRITDQSATFSLMQLTRNTRVSLTEKPVTMPRGPMGQMAARLRQFAEAGIDVTDQTLHVVLHADRRAEGAEAASEDVYEYRIVRDERGCAKLEKFDDDTSPDTIEVPRGAVRMSLITRSPAPAAKGLIVAAFAIIYPIEGGKPSTVRRLASLALSTLTGVREFRMLALIDSVDVPALRRPTRGPKKTTSKAGNSVTGSILTHVFAPDDGQTQPPHAGTGRVEIAIDLTEIGAGGKLQVKITPSEELTSLFETYPGLGKGAEKAVLAHLDNHVEDAELERICYEVVLSEVTISSEEALRAGLSSLAALLLSPRQYSSTVA